MSKKILEKKESWELKRMKKALESLGGFFNTDEENETLQSIKTILKRRRK